VLWLAVARSLVASHQVVLLGALVIAWIAAFGLAADTVRRAFGSPANEAPPAHGVPWPARAALWCAAAGLALLLVRR
jgi:hypothetical protein